MPSLLKIRAVSRRTPVNDEGDRGTGQKDELTTHGTGLRAPSSALAYARGTYLFLKRSMTPSVTVLSECSVRRRKFDNGDPANEEKASVRGRGGEEFDVEAIVSDDIQLKCHGNYLPKVIYSICELFRSKKARIREGQRGPQDRGQNGDGPTTLSAPPRTAE